jgi:hypothetical protein
VKGREWEGHDASGNKIGVVISGPKTCYWQNFHSGQAGQSGLTLIRDLICNGDFVAAWHWALEWIGGGIADKPTPRAEPKPPQERKRGEPDKSVGMFLHAQPFAWDNPVGLYLRGRGIEPDWLGDIRLGALRFHPHCWNAETQRHMPAMIAAVIDPALRVHIGVHRTYLECMPSGRWRKAPLETAKKLLGAGAGGIIPLTRGASHKPLSGAPEGDCALLGEGIENTLSIAIGQPARRALAYIAAGNLPGLQLPIEIADLMLIRDRDTCNKPAVARARDKAIYHWINDEGRKVSVWEPPHPYKDANDWLMGVSNAA